MNHSAVASIRTRRNNRTKERQHAWRQERKLPMEQQLSKKRRKIEKDIEAHRERIESEVKQLQSHLDNLMRKKNLSPEETASLIRSRDEWTNLQAQQASLSASARLEVFDRLSQDILRYSSEAESKQDECDSPPDIHSFANRFARWRQDRDESVWDEWERVMDDDSKENMAGLHDISQHADLQVIVPEDVDQLMGLVTPTPEQLRVEEDVCWTCGCQMLVSVNEGALVCTTCGSKKGHIEMVTDQAPRSTRKHGTSAAVVAAARNRLFSSINSSSLDSVSESKSHLSLNSRTPLEQLLQAWTPTQHVFIPNAVYEAVNRHRLRDDAKVSVQHVVNALRIENLRDWEKYRNQIASHLNGSAFPVVDDSDKARFRQRIKAKTAQTTHVLKHLMRQEGCSRLVSFVDLCKAPTRNL